MNDAREPERKKLKARKPPPLSSFSPILTETLIRGTREIVTLDFRKPTPDHPHGLDEMDGARKATKFIQRIQTLRSRMRAEKHELADLVYKAVIRQLGRYSRQGVFSGTPWIVTIGPADNDMEDVIVSQTNIEMPKLSTTHEAAVSSIPRRTPDSLLAALPIIEEDKP